MKADELEREEKWEEPRFLTGKINEENQLIRQREEIGGSAAIAEKWRI